MVEGDLVWVDDYSMPFGVGLFHSLIHLVMLKKYLEQNLKWQSR